MDADAQSDQSNTSHQDAHNMVNSKEAAAFETEPLQTESLTPQYQPGETPHPEIALHSCKYCTSIIIDMRKESADGPVRESDAVRWKHLRGSQHTGFTSTQGAQAARDGCELFASLVRGSYFVALDSNAERPIHVEFSIRQHDRSIISLHEYVNGRAGVMLLAQFELYPVPKQPLSYSFLGNHLLPPNLAPNSQLSFTRARRWLADCRSNHRQCRNFNIGYMPTRVLEVSHISQLSGPPALHVRLAENPEPGPYATLSYCWGGNQGFKTLKDRVLGYKHEIPLHTLAQTIKDALTVTHGMGFKYLWVDVLCIIQDDEEDKMREISKMHHIYRGSLFTIAATVAKNSSEGFLHPRTMYRGFKLRVRTDNDSAIEVAAMPTRTSQDANPYHFDTRAWTFQEMQLSTRVFAYGNRGMVYHCLESKHCDGGHQHPVNTHKLDDAISAIFKNLDPGSQLLRSTDHPFAWGEIMDAYTQRWLSFAADKLPAIAAIAEEYSRTRPVTGYLAGMWKEDLLYQCLWFRASFTVWEVAGADTVVRPGMYRAPSWSWAALDGHFCPSWLNARHRPSAPEYHFSCELVDAQVTLCEGAARFGAVQGGFMRLRGRMRRVVWLSPGHNENFTDSRGYRCCWAYGDRGEDWLQGGRIPWDKRLGMDIDVVGEWPGGTEITLWCIEFCTFVGERNFVEVDVDGLFAERGSSSILEGQGLVLEPVNLETAGEATFRRVGQIGFKGLPPGDPFFDRWPYWFDDGESEWREIVVI